MDAKEMRRRYATIGDKRFIPFVKHDLADVLILVQCAVMCGMQQFEDICEYGHSKHRWLRKTFGIEKIPSTATLCRIMSMVEASAVVDCVVACMKAQLGEDGDQIALDGKTIRATAKEATAQERLHIVTMYMTHNGVILGQKAVPEKTNEIPVVRELLQLFNLAGKVVTADAMHSKLCLLCNRETAETIIRQGGDYVLALKGNQSLTQDEIGMYLEACIADPGIQVESTRTYEKNRNRMEIRTCYKAPSLDWLASKEEWAGLKSAFAIRRKVITKEKTTKETEYYLSSVDAAPARILEIVRNHWRIETLHWMLDVLCGEDESQLQNANAHQTLNIFRKNAIALHREYIAVMPQKTKPTVKAHMLRAALNDQTLQNVIFRSHPMK
jgi:predicted transposase YbfD/YdcC